MFFFEINWKLSVEENSIYRNKCLLFLRFSNFFFVFLFELQLLLTGCLGEVSVTIYLFRMPVYDLYMLWELMLENYLVLF